VLFTPFGAFIFTSREIFNLDYLIEENNLMSSRFWFKKEGVTGN